MLTRKAQAGYIQARSTDQTQSPHWLRLVLDRKGKWSALVTRQMLSLQPEKHTAD